jgi:hypothetical protein
VGTNPEHLSNPDEHEPVIWIGRDRSSMDKPPAADVPAAVKPDVVRKWLLPAGVVLLALLLASASFLLMGRKPHVTPLMHQE